MKFRKFIVLGLAVALLGFSWSCDKDDDETEPAPTQQEDNASGTVTSTSDDTTIETPAGAKIIVPQGAVPALENGDPATVVFSIEADDDFQATPPAGETMATRVYRFGPEGFTFERKVTVEIPIPDDVDLTDKEVLLYRINPTTGDNELYTGSYNLDDRTIYAQTYHFSPWFASFRDEDPQGNGCAWVVNNSDLWVGLCVTEYTLDFPDRDGPFIPDGGWSSSWAPWNHGIGSTNEGEWWLPQGTFTVCITYSHDAGLSHTHRIASNQLVIDNPAHGTWSSLQNWDCTEFAVGSSGGSEADGRCNCVPIPTVPVGTGDIQVTLTWFNENALDLDLWVTDPTDEKCYYGNTPSSTGGDLDRDNLCGNYENGRPENIYWTATPPAGEYIVEVDWFSSCSHEHGSQAFTVRTVVQGVTNTYSQTITEPNEQNWESTVEVVRFNIAGGAVTFSEGRGQVSHPGVVRPSKN